MRAPSIVIPEHGRACDIAAPGKLVLRPARWLS